MSGLKSNFEQLKWVFIDLDDTLWDFTANSANALHILYHRVPVLQQLYADYSEYDEAYHFKNAELWNLYHHGEITQEFLKIERFRWLLCRKNIECTVEEALRQNDLYLSILGEQTLLVDGAVELLEYLSKRYLIGIISNGFLNIQYKKLYATDLNKYIQRMIVSDEIGIQKPDRRIFDYALSETGVDSDEVIFIGDNPDADIKGAIQAGWRAVYYDRKKKGITDVEPDAVISDLREVIKLL